MINLLPSHRHILRTQFKQMQSKKGSYFSILYPRGTLALWGLFDTAYCAVGSPPTPPPLLYSRLSAGALSGFVRRCFCLATRTPHT